MRTPENIGNYLSFFNRLSWQHRFQAYSGSKELKLKDWAIIWPKNSLPAFQVMVDGAKPSSVTWSLINLESGTSTNLDEGLLYEACYADNEYTSYTFEGSAICTLDVECGFYYMTLKLDDTTYYSEVFKLTEIPDKQSIDLAITDCNLVSPGVDQYPEWTIEATDCLSITPTAKYIGATGESWEEAADSATFDDTNNSGSVVIYRKVTSNKGVFIQRYQLTYNPADPCNTYTFTKL